MADNIIPRISDEEFIKEYGCDKETYDKLLCENEDRIFKEREEIYNNYINTIKNLNPYSFIGKHLSYSSKYIHFENILISDIREVTGNPDHFETYYSIYTKDEKGEEKWLINVTIDDFMDSKMFT